MKGQFEPLVQRAIRQAQREADSLYNLIVTLNVTVLDSAEQREREYTFLAGYMSAVMNGDLTKDRIQYLRSAVLMSIEPVIILDAAIDQVVSERLSGQPALFSDSAGALAEMLRMATDLSKWFNTLANCAGAAAIKQEVLRSSLRAEIDRRIAIWASHADLATLISVGKTEEINSARDRLYLLSETGSRRD